MATKTEQLTKRLAVIEINEVLVELYFGKN
jgi:hypothetical protein